MFAFRGQGKTKGNRGLSNKEPSPCFLLAILLGVRSCNITFYLLVLIFLIALITVVYSRQYILLSICYIARPDPALSYGSRFTVSRRNLANAEITVVGIGHNPFSHYQRHSIVYIVPHKIPNIALSAI